MTLYKKLILPKGMKRVRGLMSDPERLEKERIRIREATKDKFREYDLARYRANVLARERWLD